MADYIFLVPLFPLIGVLINGLLFSQTKPEHAESIQTLMIDAGGGRQVPIAGLFKLLP